VPEFRTPQVILFSQNPPTCCCLLLEPRIEETFRVPTEGEPIHVDFALDGYKIGIASFASTRDDHGLDPVPDSPRTELPGWCRHTNGWGVC
jgi:glyoxylase I family protein